MKHGEAKSLLASLFIICIFCPLLQCIIHCYTFVPSEPYLVLGITPSSDNLVSCCKGSLSEINTHSTSSTCNKPNIFIVSHTYLLLVLLVPQKYPIVLLPLFLFLRFQFHIANTYIKYRDMLDRHFWNIYTKTW